MPFRRMKAFFFSKYSVSSSYFLTIPTLNFFWFLAKKTSKTKWKDIFKKKYHLRRVREKISHMLRFRKISRFFSRNPSIFPKKTKFRTFWEFLLFQSHSKANLLQFGEKIISPSDVNKNSNSDVDVNAIGKHWVKKRTHLMGRFCFHILNMAQNNNRRGLFL